ESTDRYDFLDGQRSVATVLRLRLEMVGGRHEELELDSLRFYLNADLRTASLLYEVLAGHGGRVCVLPEGARKPTVLAPDALRPVGLGADEEVLPQPPFA